MKSRTTSLILASFLICFPGWGQQTMGADRPPLPDGPLIKRAPDYSSWKVVSSQAGAGGSSRKNPETAVNGTAPIKTGPLKEVLVIKTKGIIYEKILMPENKVLQVWRNNGLKIMIMPDYKKPVILPDTPSGDIYDADYSKSDFAGLGWVSEKTYVGLQKVKGHDCIVFKDKISVLSAGLRREIAHQQEDEMNLKKAGRALDESERIKDEPADVTVWIDLESRLPVVAMFGTEVRQYQFGQAPTVLLALPPELAAMQKQYLDRKRKN